MTSPTNLTSSIQVSELLPCPFCGDSATIDRDLNYTAALCTNCNARSARFVDATLKDDSEAIAAWNMRSKDHSIAVDDVERVAKAICAVATDEDPDEIILPGTPRWVAYIPEADAAITAIGSQSIEGERG